MQPTQTPDRADRATRPGGRRAVSAGDVARVAGVSKAAVSYVFNGRTGVSDATRDHVRSVAASLGYERSIAEHDPRRIDVLGLVLSNVANPFYPELSVAFTAAAAERGYGVFLAHTDDAADSLGRTVHAMAGRGLAGVAIAVARSDSAAPVRELRSGRIPFVQVSRSFSGELGDFVGIDDVRAARQIAAHAIQHGRGPFATIIGPRASSASQDRERGLHEELRSAGIEVPATMRISTELTLDGGRAAAAHLLAMPRPPRFILCGSDVLALGVLAQASTLGRSIPGDLSVSGFDGTDLCATGIVGLTGIVQPRAQLASVAASMLIDRIGGRTGPWQRTRLEHQLRIGRTCGCGDRHAVAS